MVLYQRIGKYIFIGFCLAFVPFLGVKSQDTIRVVDEVKVDTLRVDTVGAIQVTSDNVAQTESRSLLVYKKKSPTKAALLSAVFPGAGQMYNGRFWKVPFVYAAIGISGYYFIRNQRWYKDYLEGYVNYSNTKDPSIVQRYDKIRRYAGTGIEERAFEAYVDQYRRWRDWSVVFLAGSYLLSIIDATVDAYLFDYDISENLSLKVSPAMINSTIASSNAFGLRLSFNLH